MTFCLGMKCTEGLIALADTRITSGTETSTAKKIWVHQDERASFFVLTSGLRSVRDKALTYLRERLEDEGANLRRLHNAANILSEEIRRTRTEDQRWLEAEGLHFDLHCIIGGQMAGEDTHRLFLVYPEGNWVEVGDETPFVIIGESRYGKPVLDRLWRHDAPLQQGLRDALLAFDATRTSASDVGYPLDVVSYEANAFRTAEQRFERADLEPVAEYWQRSIRTAATGADPLVAPLFQRLHPGPVTRDHDAAWVA